MELLAFVGILLGAIAIGVPIVYGMGLAGGLLLLISGAHLPLDAFFAIIAKRMYSGVDSFPLLAIPLFFLTGTLMDNAGLSARLLGFASALVGHIRGGLLMVVVLAEAFLAAVAGSPSAVAAAIGSVAAPTLKEKGYDGGFYAATIAAGGTVGPIIPPSIMLVVFGALANESIAALFLGGVLPGLLMAGSMMAFIYWLAVRRGYPAEPRLTLRAAWRAFLKAALPLGAPAVILGGIFSGIFTATESAAAACLYAIIIGMFVYRTMSLRGLGKAILEAAVGSARVMIIIAVASFVGWVLAREAVPQQLTELLLGLSDNTLVILLLINLVFLVLGCFVEGIALMVILVPTLAPVLQSLDVNMVYFGVMLVINLTIGTITPPVGTCLMISSAVTGVPFATTARHIVPFIGVLVFTLLLSMLIPELILILPETLLG